MHLAVLPILLSRHRRSGQCRRRRRLLQGQDRAHHRRRRRRLGLRHQRARAGAPSHHAHSRQSDRDRAEPARRRQRDHDQHAVQQRTVRRHRDRRVVQRPARRRRCWQPSASVRFDAIKLNWIGIDQSRIAGDVCLAQRAAADARRSLHQGDDRRRAGAGLDPIRLSGARARAVRHEVQGHHRLRGDAEDPSRDGARRGARHLGQLVDAQGDRRATGCATRRSASWRNGTSRSIPRCPTFRCSSTSPRPTPTSRRCNLAIARLEFGRPFFMPPNVPADRVAAVRRAFDATDEGQGVSWPTPRSSRSKSIR